MIQAKTQILKDNLKSKVFSEDQVQKLTGLSKIAAQKSSSVQRAFQDFEPSVDYGDPKAVEKQMRDNGVTNEKADRSGRSEIERSPSLRPKEICS